MLQTMLGRLLLLPVLFTPGLLGSNPHHEPTDYCAWLAEDDIQGLKHGFLAGNNVYYIAGRLHGWGEGEDHETLGLTHPFFHDLRCGIRVLICLNKDV